MNDTSTLTARVKLYFIVYEKYLLPTVATLGFVGNLLVLFVFLGRRMPAPRTLLLLIVQLMISDDITLVCLVLIQTLRSYDKAMYILWPGAYPVSQFSTKVSIYTTVLVVVNRWLAITRPLTHGTILTLRRSILSSAAIVAGSACFCLPLFWKFSCPQGPQVGNSSTYDCSLTVVAKSYHYAVVYEFGLNLFLYRFVPFVLVAVMNTWILWTLRAAAQERSVTLHGRRGSEDVEARSLVFGHHSTTWMLSLQALIFLAQCLLHMVVAPVILVERRYGGHSHIILLCNVILYHVNLLSYASNFFVFLLFGTQFRKRVKALLPGRFALQPGTMSYNTANGSRKKRNSSR